MLTVQNKFRLTNESTASALLYFQIEQTTNNIQMHVQLTVLHIMWSDLESSMFVKFTNF